MRILLILILTLFSSSSFASEIVAVVNSKPITKYEYINRKKMIYTFNGISSPDARTESVISKAALNSLIEDELLLQHADKVGGRVSDKEVDSAIQTIEEKNKLPKGAMLAKLKNSGVDIKTFRSQIKSELIKSNIISYLSRTVSVGTKEADNAILFGSTKDAEVSVIVFTAKENNPSSSIKMNKFGKSLKTCESIKESSYSSFADMIKIDNKLSKLDSQIQAYAKDLKVDQVSSVFVNNNQLKMIMLCSRNILGLTKDENDYVINFLTHKKMNFKAQKFFKDLRKRAYVKVMINV